MNEKESTHLPRTKYLWGIWRMIWAQDALNKAKHSGWIIKQQIITALHEIYEEFGDTDWDTEWQEWFESDEALLIRRQAKWKRGEINERKRL